LEEKIDYEDDDEDEKVAAIPIGRIGTLPPERRSPTRRVDDAARILPGRRPALRWR